jgi:hypothetical protein
MKTQRIILISLILFVLAISAVFGGSKAVSQASSYPNATISVGVPSGAMLADGETPTLPPSMENFYFKRPPLEPNVSWNS